MSRAVIEGTDGQAFVVANDCNDCEATHVTHVDTRGITLDAHGLRLLDARALPLFAEAAAVLQAREDGWHGLFRCPACSVGLYPPRGEA